MSLLDRIFKILAIGFSIAILFSLIAMAIYVNTSQISFQNSLSESFRQTDINFDFINSLNHPITRFFGFRPVAGEYQTRTYQHIKHFHDIDSLHIMIQDDAIQFIEEDRSDLLVEYTREYPDSPGYQIDYSATAKNGTLDIKSSVKSKGLILNRKFNQALTIRLPLNYCFDNLLIYSHSGYIEQSSSCPRTKNLTIDTDLSDIQLSILQDLEQLHLNSNLGNIKLTVSQPVSFITTYTPLGDTSIHVLAPVQELSCFGQLGKIQLISNAPIAALQLDNQQGQIKAQVNSACSTMSCSTGSGDIFFQPIRKFNPIAVTSHSGSVISLFQFTNQSDSKYHIFSSAGNIYLE